jgi:hypothetical protein
MLNVGVRPGDSVGSFLSRVKNKWGDLRGTLEAYFPQVRGCLTDAS